MSKKIFPMKLIELAFQDIPSGLVGQFDRSTILRAVDLPGQPEYRWNGVKWVASVEATTDVTGEMVLTAAGIEISAGGSPVKITGTSTVGSVLTAALQSGWSATGYQWTRAGVDISGATSGTYTLQSADAGTSVACRVTGLSNLATGVAIASVAPSVFVTSLAVFDGNQLTATIPSGRNSSLGSVSFWFTSNSTNASFRTIFIAGKCTVTLTSTLTLRVTLLDSTSAKTFVFTTQSAAQDGHYAIEWDTSPGAGLKVANILFNGVSLPLTVADASVGFVVDYQSSSFVGASAALANPVKADIGELMFWPGTFANWTANINKVYSVTGPVDPGANGATPLGGVPDVYLSIRSSDLAATLSNNRGSGPAYALSGTTLQRADESIIGYGDSLLFGTGSSVNSRTAWLPMLGHGLNRPIKVRNHGVGGTAIDQIATIMESGGFSQPAASVPMSLTRARLWALEGGYNSVAGIVSNGLSVAFTPFPPRMVNTMLSLDASARWIYMGIPSGNITVNNALYGDRENLGNGRNAAIVAANAWLASQYGTHFLDINAWLIANWLSIDYTPAAGPAVMTPTATDSDDVANNVVPSSLRSADGSVHWNDYGHYAVYLAVRAKMQSLGYD